ncbi:LPXTG cell wall anchor domain-containing protein [Streptomyces sp. NPDC013953]|uniref:LPXTG cell wall anchor domain-containing protein n=1 Tax=Streptomyces sp. NPDC013953 TaxID=3364868 RepID=UPI0036F80B75
MTTPVVMLSVTPAYADAEPAASHSKVSGTPTASNAPKASIEELEKAAAAAQKAYDDAVAAEKAAYTAMDAAFSDEAPHAVASRAAKKAAADAAAATTAAEQALTAAEAELAALPAEATEEQKAAAQKAVDDAKAALGTAKAAQADADAKATAAATAADDARVAAARKYEQARQATADALKAKQAADKALADAKAEEGDEDEDGDEDDAWEDCVDEPQLTSVVNGLPSKVVAGTTVSFSVRVTNGSDKTLDDVYPFVAVYAVDKSGYNSLDDLLTVQWSTAASPKWQVLGEDEYIDSLGTLKAGAHADVKLRLSVDAKAPAGAGVAFVAGDYLNEDGTCGGSPELQEYTFEIAAAGTKPGKVEDAKPSGTTPHTPGTAPQGTAGRTVSATGTLANTGSSSAVPQIALAGGVAVALGAGAMFVVRRRKADANG